MVLFLQLVIIAFLLYVIWNVTYTMIRGAPYAPLGEEKTRVMMSLLKVEQGKKAIDLGAGDGRIVIALAKKGFESHGYEINPLLALWAKWNIKQAGVSKNAFIHIGDFWETDLGKFDVITIYLTSHIMRRLEKKIMKEAVQGAQIVVNYFKLPTLKPTREKNKMYLYKINNREKQ